MELPSWVWYMLLLYLARQAWGAPLDKLDQSDLTSKRPLLYITLEEHYDPRAIIPLQNEDPVYDLYGGLVTPEMTKYI